MTWDPPSYTLNVALAFAPFKYNDPQAVDTAEPADFTDLSSRIRNNIAWRKGRNDTRSAFDPASFTVELDNGDRMLDPLNPAGLVYTADGLGLPLCPVTVDVTFAGVTSRLFTGYLGPTCWEGGTRSIDSTVTFTAQGLMACAPSIPSYPWHIMTSALYPDWWLPMDVGFPVLEDGSHVPNRSGTGGQADVEGGVGDLGRVTDQGTLSPNALKWSPGMVIRSNMADVMPNGNETDMAGWMFWTATTPLDTGQSARVFAMSEAGTSDLRWSIDVIDTGEAVVTTYDAAVATIDTATITPSFTSRWDDGSRHLVVWMFTDGDTMDVWFGGDHATLTSAPYVYESDLVVGPSDVDTITDELALWRRPSGDSMRITSDDIAGAILATGGQAQPWHGDSWADRIEHLYKAAHLQIALGVPDNWHVPDSDPDDAFWGLGVQGNLTSDKVSEALRNTVEDGLGVVWDTRDGYLRCRTIHALTDPTYAANYATTAATFTDEDTSLPTGTFRHAGVEQSGPSTDSIINRANVTFAYLADDDPWTVIQAEIAPQDDDSVYGPTLEGGYGVRQENYTIARYGWTAAATLADTVVGRYSQPVAQIDTLHLDATGNDELTAWLCASLELELAVDVTYTPFGADPVTYETLNIQSIEWRQTADGKLLVDLGVGRS